MSRRSLLALAPLLAAAGGEEDPILLSVTAETPPGGAMVQAMVRLVVRAIFISQPNRVTLDAPEFVDARWLVLGDDDWGHITLAGPERVLLERRIAWFAQRSGQLEVGPFRLRATLIQPDGQRVVLERRSAPLTIAVAPPPDDAGWWLPARDVRLSQHFSVDPAALAPGQVTRRTVVIAADGVEAPQLPALPRLRADGVIAFALPVATETRVMPQGPVVRATYAWDLRPVSDTPALLPEIRVPWFDTATRQMRAAVLPPQPVRLGEAAAGPPPPPAPGLPGRDLAAGVAAFVAASAVLAAPRQVWRAVPGRLGLAWALHRAASRGDALAVRALLARAPDSAERGRAMAAIDRHAYASPPGPAPQLGGLARAVLLAPLRPGSGGR